MERLLNRGVTGSLTLLSGAAGRETPGMEAYALQKVMVETTERSFLSKKMIKYSRHIRFIKRDDGRLARKN